MPDAGEKLTIAEFAARAGCTTQRVYQLLQKTLQPFAIEENGRKYILSDGIEVIAAARKKQGFTKSLQENLPTLDKSLQAVSSPDQQPKIDELTAELATVRADLTETRAALDAARDQLDQLRTDLTDAQQRAAVAAAERDAERKRADTAERECTVKDNQMKKMQEQTETDKQDLRKQLNSLNALLQQEKEQSAAALKREQEHAAELTQALAASQALHAGQIRLAMQDGEPENAEPAQPADQSDGTPAEPPKKRGFFARLFGK